jgi:L-arabinokinase
VDVVITKPGYGILSDCIANGVAMLYTPRGRFVEYDVMVEEMPGLLPCHRLELEAFEDGRWIEGLRAVARVTAPPPPRTDGAEVVAAMIAERISAP